MKFGGWMRSIFMVVFFGLLSFFAIANETQQVDVSENVVSSEIVENAEQKDPLIGENLSTEELDSLIQLLSNSARIEELKGNLELLKKAKGEIKEAPEAEVVTTQITEGLLVRVKEAFFESRESLKYLFDPNVSLIPTKKVMGPDGK